MKISGRTIMQRLYGVTRLGNRISRARYFRGHGVHSPFVYAIVRQVFMKSKPVAEDELLTSFLEEGIPRKRAVQLRNLAAHCSYSKVGLDCVCSDRDLVVLTADFPTEKLVAAAEESRVCGTTLAIVAPYADRERNMVCRQIEESHRSTTVDNRGYLLVFNNHLPKQHFKL